MEHFSNARNLVSSQSVPLLLQTFRFLHTLTDPTAGPPDFAIRSLISQYLKDTLLPHFADAGMKATSALFSSCDIDTMGSGVEDMLSKDKSGVYGSEVDELLMHMSLADDGQVIRATISVHDAKSIDESSRMATLSMRSKLNDWFESLPAEIKVDTASLPDTCAPPHIFASNLILFHHIFIPNILPAPTAAPINLMREASRACTVKAEEIHKLLGLFSKSFGLQNMTYIMTWSIYSAANINAIDFIGNDADLTASGAKLSMSMYVLEQCIPQMPGIKRSIEILKHQLRRPRSIASTKRGISTLFPESTSVADTDEDGARKLRRPRTTSIEALTTTPQQRACSLEGAQTCLSSIISNISCMDPERLLGTMPSSHPQQTKLNNSTTTAPLGPQASYSGQTTSLGSKDDQIQSSISINTPAIPNEECFVQSPKAVQPETCHDHERAEIDDWGALYSLLTVQDATDVDAIFAASGLGQIDLSQGVMAVPSFVESEITGQVDPWAAYFNENME
ncbi:hypothetical protein G7054_g7724 [Neopestalotiopsis clavispora]|nr:hypothetical protein G7054_g7724 [Neopestalotiopsis clavispora]